MNVVLCGTRDLAQRIGTAAPLGNTVTLIENAEHLASYTGHQPVDCVVMHLSAIRQVSLSDAFLRSWFPRHMFVPFVMILDRFSAIDVRNAMRLIRETAAELLIAGIDDAPPNVWHTIQRAIVTCEATAIADALTRHVEPPPALLAAIRTWFAQPHVFAARNHVVADGTWTRRSIDRWLAAAGLVPSGRVIQIARLHFAAVLMGCFSFEPGRAALEAGISSPRALNELTHRTMGLNAGQLATIARDRSELRQRVVASLFRHARRNTESGALLTNA